MASPGVLNDSQLVHTEGYGANCHFHQYERLTPACIITDAKGKEIIASSSDEIGGNPAWAVRSVTVTLTRLWSASVATIYLTTSVVDLPDPPPSIPFELHPEQQIAIYLGYVEGPRELTLKDIENNNLIRVFIGVVDTMTAACTGKVGYSVKVQCRDRVKWFMDSSLLFNLTKDEEPLLGTGEQAVNRAEAIWFILNAAIGRDGSCKLSGGQCNSGRTDCEGCGVKLQPGKIIMNPAQGNGPSEFYGSAIKGRVENVEPTDPYNVKTNIYPSRSYLGDQAQKSFMLVDNSALETIKRLSYMEVFPTEFFQDPHTGELYYAPKGVDMSGLDDPKRFNRTYFVRVIPPGMEVKDINQMVLSFKEEASTINLRTNVVVGGTANDGSGDHVLHFKAAPAALRKIPHACRYALYQDQSITSVLESAYIALAWSREQGRLLRSVDMTVIGDPSFALGEALQVIASPLQFNEDGKGTQRDKALYEKERSELSNWATQATNFYTAVAQAAPEQAGKPIPEQASAINGIPPYPGNNKVHSEIGEGRQEQTDVGCKPDTWINDKFYNDDLPTMWRVDSITHHFKATGYVTELLLGLPF
jgi:hypothetical protein